jgi:hypothetical protein
MGIVFCLRSWMTDEAHQCARFCMQRLHNGVLFYVFVMHDPALI